VRLLVTGANGQIGWELRRSLAPLGEVIALDRAQCDLSRPAEAVHIVGELKPDVVVNAAAYTAVDKAEAEEELATIVNGEAVDAIAQAVRRLDGLFVHYSTDYVFDGTKDVPYLENDLPNPINAYGRSKLAGERAIIQCGGSYLILRTSWVYAARGHNFLRTMLRLARERDELRIVSDQIGAPTWARDIANATASMVSQARREQHKGSFSSGIFNVTAGAATSWFGFAQAIAEEAKPQGLRWAKLIPISSSEYSQAAARPKNSRLAPLRLHQRFGLSLRNWKDALALCVHEVALGQSHES
jgi:dTDP-4-dehydrorhamnose reductase